MSRFWIFLLGFLFTLQFSIAQQKPIFDQWFYPNTGLPKKAVTILFQDSLSLRPFQNHQPISFESPLINQPISAQYRIPSAKVPETFTLEIWLLNHVNEPIGFEIKAGEKWHIGVWENHLYLKTAEDDYSPIPLDPWREYWSHLVLAVDQGQMILFENGKKVGAFSFLSSEEELVINGYFHQEPYMQLDDYVKHLAIYPDLWDEEQAKKSFGNHQNLTLSGNRFPDRFHFLAEPYLFQIDSTTMQIIVETDRQSTVELTFGTELPLQNKLQLSPKKDNLFTTQLGNLESGKAYFYQIKANSNENEQLDSGVLTFKTSPSSKMPIVFGVVSDTEARPHINEHIGLKIWDERPDFVLHMGDVTDGGKEKNKWQWTQEYFPGVSALTSRIPMVPVPGNGEGDLFWYNYYHPQANPGGFYKMESGPATFFILNSNQSGELQPGGKQYEWMKTQLTTNKSKWKFVAMHHAPYSADEDDYGNTWKGKSTFGDRKLQPLILLLEEAGVDVYFFGHLHNYMRSFPLKGDQLDEKNGIHYVQLGGMGGNLEDFAPNHIWFSEKTFRGFHYGMVSLTPNRFELRVYNTEGAMVDRLEIKK
ncbi:MAG: putative phosphodiesterase [Algoriphagus sp.]|jgi:predicted phosphodiesterase